MKTFFVFFALGLLAVGSAFADQCPDFRGYYIYTDSDGIQEPYIVEQAGCESMVFFASGSEDAWFYDGKEYVTEDSKYRTVTKGYWEGRKAIYTVEIREIATGKFVASQRVEDLLLENGDIDEVDRVQLGDRTTVTNRKFVKSDEAGAPIR
jgi:hypothetical protein